MHVISLALTLQLQIAALAGAPSPATAQRAGDDSLRDLGRAHEAQAMFEHQRRNALPWGFGSGGRCDVRIGRFCWWYEDASVGLPAEPEEIGQRRTVLLASLDTLAEKHPGDPWITGIRVYYRVDNRQPAFADSAARACRGERWWCAALVAYAARARGALADADSGFADALSSMPDSVRCAWRDIAPVLPPGPRERYERLSCAQREPMESRYWSLATPRLSLAANEWRTEYFARHVVTTLLGSAVTPHPLSWSNDSAELLLRYGWPVAWSRTQPSSMAALTPEIFGHDPSPSFHYGPRTDLLDSVATTTDDGWDLTDVHAESRYAHPQIRRIAGISTQLARFRRGDSTLLVAAWAAGDDSLLVPRVSIGAVQVDARLRAAAGDSTLIGRGRLMLARPPRLAGVEVSDTATGVLARSRTLFPDRRDSAAVTLSDMLVYRPADETAPQLDEALARAIPGDTVSVAHPVGLYWETYGAPLTEAGHAALETSIDVERIDRGFFRGARQRLGLLDPESPIRIRWADALGATAGLASRALSLDLGNLPAGRYRVTLTVGLPGLPGASTSREVTLTDR